MLWFGYLTQEHYRSNSESRFYGRSITKAPYGSRDMSKRGMKNGTSPGKKSIYEDRYYRPDNFPKGLTRKVVESISHIKNEPGWLTSFRLKAFEIYEQKPMPTWGFFPNFNVDIDSYTHYIGSNQQKKKSWDEVDPEVLKSFERLGIPEHERKYLAGIEAMNDSETVYANVKKELTELGILFCDIDTAIREYPEIVKNI